MSHEFYVGQKVVCVNDGALPDHESCTYSGLKAGEVYTITSIDGPGEWFFIDGSPGELALHVDGAAATWRGEPWPMNSCRFRPVVKTQHLEGKKSDISIFRRIAQGVTDGKPIIEDAEYRESDPLEEEEDEVIQALNALFGPGRPIL